MKILRIAAVITAATLVITGCSRPAEKTTQSVSSSNAASSNNSAFEPVTIKHAFGETMIKNKPTRIATLGWGSQDVALALGVVPVGMSRVSWSDTTGSGMMPWTEEKLKELGGATPALFDDTDSIPYSQVSDAQPDLILATYSGITEENYKELTKTAPTIAYPDKPWSTSLEQLVEVDSKAMGKEAEGKKLLADLKQQIKTEVDKHSDLKGKKVLFSSFGPQNNFNKLGFYCLSDPRASFLKDDVGMGVPKVVEDESKKSNDFWAEVSAEEPELFDDVDVIVAYGQDSEEVNQELLGKLQKDPLLGRIKAIKEGKVTLLSNDAVGAVANPSPLSISWGLNKYLDLVDKAVAQ